MEHKLRILNLEDNQDDFELMRDRLLRDDIKCELVRVETKEAFVAALSRGGFDLILSDYLLPSFDGLSALKIVRKQSPEVPFIFVSGAIGEEVAVEALKKGATDYVLKDRLSRLVPVINRALIEADEHARRRQAEEEVRRYRMHLEDLVRDRTTELKNVNEQLQRELAERKRAEEALYRREQEFKALVENAPDIVQRFDRDFRHLYINPAVERLSGAQPQSLIGKSYRELGFPRNIVSAWEKALQRVFETGRESVIEFGMPTRHGLGFIEARLVPEFSKNGSIESVLAISRDITDRKKLEEKLHAASITDELTGLINRRGFLLFARKQLEIVKRSKKTFSILFLDLDEMKRINDEFGHKEGDKALAAMADILKKTFRESDIIARIGGDEFAILMTDPPGAAIEKTVAHHIKDSLRVHNEQSGKGYRLSVSMGMVYHDQAHPRTVEQLLSRADELMYEHKQKRHLKEMIPQGEKQERAYERHEARDNHPAEIIVSGTHMIKNISAGGISIKTSQRLAKNTIYRIRMLSDVHGEVSLTGLVIWSSLIGRVSEKNSSKPYYETGLRFVELDDRMISSLKQFIDSINKRH